MYGVRQQSHVWFRVALLVVASSDLLLRTSDELLLLVLSTLSISTEVGLLTVLQWVVVFVALFVLVPDLYPPPTRGLAEMVSFRTIIALTGVGTTYGLTDPDGLDDVGLVVLLALGFVAATTVVLRRNDVPFFDPESPLSEGLDWFALHEDAARKELDRAKEYDGWRRTLALGIFALAVQVMLYAPVLVAAAVATMLVAIAPLPDVLAIAYVLGKWVGSRVDRLSSPSDRLNVGDYLLTFARHAGSGIHGMFVSLLFGVGILLTVAPPLVVFRNLVGLLGTALRPPILPLLAWNVVGICALVLSAALYGLWFWIRMTPRTTAFLERWNDAPHRTSLEARPKSLVLPVFFALGVASVGVSNDFLGANKHLFAAAWPVPVVAIGWVVLRTRRRHPSVPRREDVFVTASVLLAVLGLRGTLAILAGDLATLLSPQTGLLCGIVLYVSALGRVSRYGDRHDRRYGDRDDERRYALPLYLGNGGLLALLSTGYVAGVLGGLLFAAGGVLVASSVALGIAKRYHL